VARFPSPFTIPLELHLKQSIRQLQTWTQQITHYVKMTVV